MNDFTKEELEAISDELEGTLYHQLRQKIQTMIDNYQEIKIPTMANYCCPKCNEEWRECECKDE